MRQPVLKLGIFKVALFLQRRCNGYFKALLMGFYLVYDTAGLLVNKFKTKKSKFRFGISQKTKF